MPASWPEHPRFEILRPLGSGGNGVVYEAFDRDRGASVALKTLQRLGPLSLLRLKEEFRAVADVAHPNLVVLHDLFVDGQEGFLTMELVRGRDVIRFVRSEAEREAAVVSPAAMTMTLATGAEDDATGAPAARAQGRCAADEARVRSALAQLVAAVRALHAAGKLHRDLKPSNVLVTDDGRLKVLDFGLVVDRDRTPKVFEGTAAYAAPEQARGDALGPPTDWYAVGVILFEALTGALPFPGSGLQMLVAKQQRDAPRVDEHVAGAPADLVDLCADLLAIDPGARPDGEAVARRIAGGSTRALGPVVPREGRVTVIGRDREIGRLDAALARSREAGPAIVAVEGPSGIGKSTLVRAFVERAEARGARSLAGRCSRRESVPYNAFDGIVDALARRVDHPRAPMIDAALARVFPVLSRAPGSPAGGEIAPDLLRDRAFAALREILADLAAEAPLVLAIDDWQWADGDSRALLDALLRAPAPLPALFVITRRDGEDAPALPWAVDRIPLAPLDDGAARALAARLVPGDVEPIVRAARGHPLFLQEVARHALAQAGAAPTDLDDALRARVAALPASSRRLVELLAVAVTPLREATIAAATAIDGAEVAQRIEHLRVDRLVRTGAGRDGSGVEPAHDRVREAVAASLDDGDRRRLHARLADIVDDPHALVHHLAGAGDREGAARRARESAAQAARALAFDRAAVLLRDALALGTHDPGAERALRAKLADALANAHRAVEAAEELLRVAATSDGPPRRAALRRAAELLLASGDLERGKAILGSLLDELGLPLPRGRLALFAALATERARVAARGLGFTPRAALDPAAVERADLLRGVVQGLGMADNLRAAVYQARALRAALDLGDPARAAQAIAVEAIFRGSRGTPARAHAAALLDHAERIAAASEAPEPACWIEAGRATLSALALDHPSSVDRLARAEAAFEARTVGATWALDSLRLIRALSLKILGNLDAIRAALPALLIDAERRSDRFLETTLRRGSVLLWLCDDDVAGAREALRKSRWAPPSDGLHIQHWLEIDALADIDLYTGALRTLDDHRGPIRALGLAPILRLQRVRVLFRAMHGRLLLARAASGRARAPSLLEAAVLADLLAREGVGYAAARAALLRAGIAALRGREDRARTQLEAALAVATRHGLELTAAVARARLAPLVGGDAGRALAAESRAWMARERVRRPDRLIAVEAPGFR
ncbi:MAG: AAA family ATPase [Minicystis sp.]